MIKLENVSDQEIILVDHLFRESGSGDESYVIPEEEIIKWANDSKVLQKIASQEILLYKNDVAEPNINKAIDILKGNLPTLVRDTEKSQYEKFYGDTVTTLLGESEKAFLITPQDGEKLIVREFQVTAPSDPNAVVLLVWDYGSENEEELLFGWQTDRFRPSNMSKIGDGNKSMAIVLVNGGIADGVRLAGYLKYDLEL